ncbi:MAG: hypothetical protein QXF35_00275 [Candidatus Bilamarchaeaceae archaeon]
MKGQVSTELMVIIAVIFVIFIPLLVFVYTKADEAQREMAAYQAQIATFRTAYLINSVGSLGANTIVYSDVYIPGGTKYFRVKNVGGAAEVQLKAVTPSGEKDFAEVVKYHVISTGDGTLVKEPSYGWTRLKISNIYDSQTNTAVVKIEKV